MRLAARIGLLSAAALLQACAGPAPRMSTSAEPKEVMPARRLEAPAELIDCQPCTATVGSGAGEVAVSFDVAPSPDGGRVIRAVEVDRPGAGRQRLLVDDMASVAPGEPFFFGPEDIDFDGHADLLLAVARGAANTYAQYWRYDPQAGRFTSVGTFPILDPDPASGTLRAYERGGLGGLLYTRTDYAWENGALEPQRIEEQAAADGQGELRRTVLERQADGSMAVVDDRTLPLP